MQIKMFSDYQLRKRYLFHLHNDLVNVVCNFQVWLVTFLITTYKYPNLPRVIIYPGILTWMMFQSVLLPFWCYSEALRGTTSFNDLILSESPRRVDHCCQERKTNQEIYLREWEEDSWNTPPTKIRKSRTLKTKVFKVKIAGPILFINLNFL